MQTILPFFKLKKKIFNLHFSTKNVVALFPPPLLLLSACWSLFFFLFLPSSIPTLPVARRLHSHSHKERLLLAGEWEFNFRCASHSGGRSQFRKGFPAEARPRKRCKVCGALYTYTHREMFKRRKEKGNKIKIFFPRYIWETTVGKYYLSDLLLAGHTLPLSILDDALFFFLFFLPFSPLLFFSLSFISCPSQPPSPLGSHLHPCNPKPSLSK